MTVRHDPLLTRALAREIAERWSRRRVVALHLAPEVRAAELRFRDRPSLLFLLHPEEGAVLAAGPALPGEGVRFRRLRLGAPAAPPDERLLLLPLVDGRGGERYRVVVELPANRRNLLLLDAAPARPSGGEKPGLRIRSALRHRPTARRSLLPGLAYRPPAGGRRWTGRPPDEEEWTELLGPVPPSERRAAALRQVAWLSAVNVEFVLGGAAREEGEAQLREAHRRYLRLRSGAGVDRAGADEDLVEGGALEGAGAEGDRDPEDSSAWLLERPRGLQPYPLSLDEPSARRADSLLAAMETALGGPEAIERRLRELTASTQATAPGVAGGARGPDDPSAVDRTLRLRRALLARRRRLGRRVAALERELERSPDPDELRAIGHLLLARLDRVPRGAARVVLEDFDGGEREVELDPRLAPPDNARRYFDGAARGERARDRLPREIESARRGLEEIDRALARLENGPTPDDLDALWKAAGGRPAAGGEERGVEEGERPPYLRYRTSGGLEIRVGRSARGNDDLTFHHSSPEDLWLHARQVQGAHVILRWGRREENPPRRDLLEAAVAAAVHSGARHSGTVAVDWTRRKYVRKPRKAPPGAVVPERVETLFVEPDAGLLDRLRAEDR